VTPRALVATAALVLAACSSSAKLQAGLGTTDELHVASRRARGGYLDTLLVGEEGKLALRVFAPDTPTCRYVLEPEQTARYRSRGAAGQLLRGDQTCDAVGIGDPFVSRYRQPRGQAAGASPVPRAQASFEKVYEDEDVIFLRGRFPLASLVGWAGGVDTIAVVQNREVCRAPAERGVASMEYRPRGGTTLALVGQGGLCRIDGLLIPPAESAR
jgi:hypothetical protein